MNEEVFLIYMGIVETISHNKAFKYACIKDLTINNGSSLNIVQYEKCILSKKFGSGNCGTIYKVKQTGDSFSYSKNILPVDSWKNESDIIDWQVLSKSTEFQLNKNKALKELGKNDLIKKQLDPIKRVFKTLNTEQKQNLTAYILTYLNQ